MVQIPCACGWELEVDRGPDWLFIRPRCAAHAPHDALEFSEQVWTLVEQSFTHRLVLELTETAVVERSDETLAALQRLARHDLLPDVVRLSDADETKANLMMASGAGAKALRASLRTRGHGEGCLLVVGWEGLPALIRARQREASSLLREGGAIRLGRRVGDSWKKHRFQGPYVRDRLMDGGLLVETLETAATWSALPTVYDAVRRALRETLTRAGRAPLVMTHVSHGYPTGASLYFTVLADRDDDLPIQQWLSAKRAATDAMLAAGGTLTHHHAVGADHRPWLEREIGPLGVEVLKAVKQRLDPKGICNPGVLLPE